MVQSKAITVRQYLKELEPEHRAVIEPVRDCINKNIRDGFEEVMNWGMISWEPPLARFPKTYNKNPLLYCSLASQKNRYAVYLMCVYSGSKYLQILEKGYQSAGLKLDMGKCCVRFKSLDGVHLPTISRVVAACSLDDFIDIHDSCVMV
jgi:hypothetical protein